MALPWRSSASAIREAPLEAFVELVRGRVECRSTRRLELVAGGPSGAAIRVCNFQSGEESKARVVDHTVEVPLGPELVARLVIALGLEGYDLLLAPVLGAADEIRAGLQIQSWHANFCKVELIRAVERTPIRKLVPLDRATEGGGDVRDDCVERGFASADLRDVSGAPPNIAAIVVQIGGNFSGGERQVFGEILRAEQARFFRAWEEHEDRAAGRGGQRLQRLHDRQYLGHAGAVVERAVVDRVARGIWLADA